MTPAEPKGITEDGTPVEIALADLINSGSGTTTITDADGDPVGGVAIVGAAYEETAEFALNGGVFSALPRISPTSALLLPPSARIRYTPRGPETVSITYRAWDMTDGTAGTSVDATSHGGATALSSATDTASLIVYDEPLRLEVNVQETGELRADAFTALDDGSVVQMVAQQTGSDTAALSHGTIDVVLDDPNNPSSIAIVASEFDLQPFHSPLKPGIPGTGNQTDIGDLGFVTPPFVPLPVYAAARDTTARVTTIGPMEPIAGTSDIINVVEANGTFVTGQFGVPQSWGFDLNLDIDEPSQSPQRTVLTNARSVSAPPLDGLATLRRNPQTGVFSLTIPFRCVLDLFQLLGADAGTLVIISGTIVAGDRGPNTAPVLAPASPAGSTDEDTPIEFALADFINNGPGTTTIVDENGDPIGGIALIDSVGNGSLAYAVNGLDFVPAPEISSASALLLPPAARLRYTPDGRSGETASITYRAWDMSMGGPGGTADTTTNGGDTAFSQETDIATLIVVDVNDAPVVTPAAPEMTTDENTPVEFALSDLINNGAGTTAITDMDGDPMGGVALVGAVFDGAAEFTTGGDDFNPLPSLSAASALLLEPGARIRYTPDDHGERVTITFRGWDVTTGTSGTIHDTSENGGTTAFSSQTDVATLIVTDVNDSPRANDLSVSTFNKQPTTYPLQVSDVDDGEADLTCTIAAQPSEGSVTQNNDCTFTFDPQRDFSDLAPGQSRQVTFIYKATDPHGAASNLATVTVSVAANNPPDARDDAGFTTDEDTILRVEMPGLLGDNGNGADSDADGHTFEVTDFQSLSEKGAEVIVSADGSFTYNPWGSATLQALDAGELTTDTFTYTITDSLGDNDTATVTVTVTGVHDLSPNPHGLFGGEVAAFSGGPGSLAPGDLNGDGTLDVLVAGSRGSVSVLLGTGEGTFDLLQNLDAGDKPVLDDLNGDGVLDIVAVTFGDDSVSVLLGNGDGTFGAPTTFAVGRQPQFVSTADLNEDGRPDLVTANYGDHNVSVLLGRGDGTFDPQSTFDVGDYPESVAFGDVDGDGALDIAAAHVTVSILRGHGDGTFAPATILPPGFSSQSVALADFNGDGALDIAAGGFGNYARVALGNGDGTFADPQTTSIVNAFAIEDLDGDGVLDIASVNYTASDSVSVVLGQGDGTFLAVARYGVGHFPWAITIDDFNGDGIPDIATANERDDTVSLLLGSGGGRFVSPLMAFDVPSPFVKQFGLGDLNGDEVLDVVTPNDSKNTVSVLLGDGHGAFRPQTTFPAGTRPQSVVLADLDRDGALDAVTRSVGGTVSVLMGNGDGTFESPTSVEAGAAGQSISLGDVNGDGKLDVVANKQNDDTVSVLLGNGDGTFQPEATFSVGDYPKFVAVGDLNRDGWDDITAADYSDDGVSVLLSNGDGTFRPRSTYLVGDGPERLALGKVDGDDVLDLVVANGTDRTLSILLGNGDGTFQAVAELELGGSNESLDLADVNSDGALDIVTTRSVLTGHGDGTFDPPQDYPRLGIDGSYKSVMIADLDGDGAGDIIRVGERVARVSLGHGNGTFGPETAPTFATGDYPASVAIADLNGDAIADAVTANHGDKTVSVLLGNGDGGFDLHATIQVGGSPEQVLLADFTGDGLSDLALANNSVVEILVGNGDGTFQRGTTIESWPHWFGDMDIADLDKDGDWDLAIAPGWVFLGNGDGSFQERQSYWVGGSSVSSVDLNKDGYPDLVGTESVRLGNGDGTFTDPLSVSFPEVAQPIGTVVFGDLNGDGSPDLAASGTQNPVVVALLGRGDGTFGSPATYTVPHKSANLALADVNGDNALDLVAAGNSDDGYGRASLLLGTGDGRFAPASSFAVGRGAGSLRTADLNSDGRVDLVTANRDDDSISVLLNQTGALSHTPRGVTAGPVDAIQFHFRDPMDTGSFALADDVARFTGPQGAINPTGYNWLNNRTLKISFPSQSAVGEYEIVIGPGILDAAGNGLDIDGDVVPGETPDDRYLASFTIVAPRLVAYQPTGATPGPIAAVRFLFSHSMDQASFSPADDIASFAGPQGPITPTGFTWLDDHKLEVAFDPQSAVGDYELVVGPQILNTTGNPLDRDADLVPGEIPDDQHTARFAIVGPRAVAHTPDGVVVGPIGSVQVTFDQAMDQTSFALSEDIVSFTGPEGAVAPVGFSWLDQQTLEIAFAEQHSLGTYRLILGPQILDLAGNALDEDRDFVIGETSDDQYVADFSLSYSGALNQDATWRPEHGVIVVDGSVTIPAGKTLTIMPRTIVKFAEGGRLTVQGTLDIQGTASDPVIMTSLRDDVGGDTNGDGDATAPQPMDWSWIGLDADGASATLDHVQVRYADLGIAAFEESTTLTVRNSIFRNNNVGLWVYKPLVRVLAENSVFVDNDTVGVFLRGDALATIRNSLIANNGFDPHPVWAFTAVGLLRLGWPASGLHIAAPTVDVENTIIALNANGIDHSTGMLDPPDFTMRNSDLYNPDGLEIRWQAPWDPPQPIGRDGNISADPLFVDRASGVYELGPGSPAIDSARAIHAPRTDMLGRFRYDDPGMANIGAGNPAFVDMGPFERQEPTLGVDLAVIDVADPDPAVVASDGAFTVTWTVENTGQAELEGGWKDALYVSQDPHLSPGEDYLLAQVVHEAALGAGAVYNETWTGPVPAGAAGSQYVLVHTNADSDFREATLVNNVGVSQQALSVDVPLLVLDVPQRGQVSRGEWRIHRFDAEPGRTVRFHLDGDSYRGSLELYVRRGAPPTASTYDIASTDFGQPDQELRLLEPLDGTYYVGVYAQQLSPFSTGYTLTAESTTLSIRQVTPDRVGNTGNATLNIVGDNFAPEAQVQLIAPDGTAIEGDESFQDAATLFATFDMLGAGADVGNYDVVVTDPESDVVTAFDILTVEPGTAPAFEANLTVPALARPGRNVDVVLEYANTGNIDINSPLLTIESNEEVVWHLPGPESLATPIAGSSVSLLGLSSDGPASVLRPGQRETIALTVQTPFAQGDMSFTLSSFGTPDGSGLDEPIDWNQLETDLRQPDTPDDAWDPVFARVQAQVGATWDDFLVMLRDNADHLAEIGQRVYDTAELFAFEFVQATTVGSPPYLEVAEDAFVPAPGLPLSFTRYYQPGPANRARLGTLGRGWSHSYEITLAERSDGSVVINGPDGFDRVFHPDGSGGYLGGLGDYATLTRQPDGGFLLTELKGLQTCFQPDGRFAYQRDTNGNKVTAVYADGLLTEVRHSSSDRFTFTYDQNGRLQTLTDRANRTFTYGYDTSGEHLRTVTRPDGEVTNYNYQITADPLTNNLLTTIHRPGNVLLSFSYDTLGRLQESHIADGDERVRYSYSSAGQVSVTDALNNTTTLWIDSRGRTARVTDPLGNAVNLDYDGSSNLTAVTGPTGLSSQFEYDAFGNLVSSRDPMEFVTSFGYGSDYQHLAWVRDARGNMSRYNYDASGNLLSITYQDGTVERYEYDSAGNLVTYHNRRGNPITYEYDSAGQLTRKRFSDGTEYTYQYDTAGRLTRATDPRGATVPEYDPENNWLNKITYPEGRWLEFTYDQAGRRTKMVDQDGFTVNYSYDAVGRLEQLTDSGGGNIVTYEYDEAGRLLRENKGVGAITTYAVYTTYTYDAAGHILDLTNHAGDGTINSRFIYNYDALGRRTSQQIVDRLGERDGIWTYKYDDNGQLIRAQFDSTGTAIGDQDFRYEYDPVGNRIRTIINSEVTDYTTNNMNQYTQVGDFAYQYGTDGNLTSKSNRTQTWTYVYNDENRLVGVLDPEHTWEYEYDALGNRLATIDDGQRTEYLVDPTGLGTVVAQYDNSENLLANYVQGIGLVSRIDAGGIASYYSFDAIGSTSDVVAVAGTPIEAYAWTPFGLRLDISASGNPFGYVGQFGVMQESMGPDYMRARFYIPELGRFSSEDILSVSHNSRYSYALNAPTAYIDPLGLRENAASGCCAASPVFSETLETVHSAVEKLHRVEIAYESARNAWGYVSNESLAITDTSVTYSTTVGITFDSAVFFKELALGFAKAGLLSAAFELAKYGIEKSAHEAHVTQAEAGRANKRASENAQNAELLVRDHIHEISPREREMIVQVALRVAGSKTPEDKFGPAGYDGPVGSGIRYVTAGQPFDYRIDFWNDPDAPVPTQYALVEDVLDPEVFDLSTFEFTRFGFLRWDARVEGGPAIDTRVDLRPEVNLAVDVSGGIDFETGKVTWTFRAVDPLTGDWPEDPLAGFLPPYDPETGYELGWVEFRVKPRDGLPSGTRIENQAFVEFDQLGDLYDHPAPKEGPWVNTIDAGIPEDASHVELLRAVTTQTTFDVQWSGQDDANGSGIGSYDIYVSIDDGPFEPWRQGITATSDSYSGEIDHTYAFYSIAIDNVGHREPPPTEPDAITHVGSNPWHNYLEKHDVNGQQGVTPLDVLLIVGYINAHPGDTSLPAEQLSPPRYYDVNDDGLCTPEDALRVIFDLNSRTAGSDEGELAGLVRVPETRLLAKAGFLHPLPSLDPGDPVGQALPDALAGQRPSVSGNVSEPGETLPEYVRHSLTYEDDNALRRDRVVTPTADSGLPDDLDPDLTYLDSILPDIAEDIAGAWQAL